MDLLELFDPEIAPTDGNLAAYLQTVLQRCAPWFRSSGASIFLRDLHGVYRLEAQYAIEPPIPPNATVVPGEGVAGACLELLQPLLVKDVGSEPLLKGRKIDARTDIGTSMVMPLILPNGSAVGVMNLSRRAGEPDFNGDDLTMAASLAHQLAMAVGTARLLAESTQAREWLRGVMECIPAAVLAVAPDGTATEANSSGKKLLQEAPRWLDPAMPQGRTRVQDPATGRSWRLDCFAAGEGNVILAEDVTDAERQAEEAGRLRRLAEVGQMSATMAHEIRNPLTGIRAAAQMVLQCPDQAPELAEIIEEEVMKLNALCEEFLDFAKPVALKLRPGTISEIIERVVRLDRQSFERAGIALNLEGPDKTPTICIDAPRVEQVLRNLLRNALQACEPGDTTTVRFWSDGFEVQDTGKGMSDEALEKLFVPFFTTKPHGTGLGLSTVRKIVDAHDGNLTVSSSLGCGARFTVDLGRLSRG